MLVDGGIRRGTDVVKALALGARAVLVGRAPLWGLVVDGEAGARRVLELLREEIELALQLVGCRTPADVTRGSRRAGSGRRSTLRSAAEMRASLSSGRELSPSGRSRSRARRRARRARRRLRRPRHDAGLDRLRRSRRPDPGEAGPRARCRVGHRHARRRCATRARRPSSSTSTSTIGSARRRSPPTRRRSRPGRRAHFDYAVSVTGCQTPIDRRERALRRADADAVVGHERAVPSQRPRASSERSTSLGATPALSIANPPYTGGDAADWWRQVSKVAILVRQVYFTSPNAARSLRDRAGGARAARCARASAVSSTTSTQIGIPVGPDRARAAVPRPRPGSARAPGSSRRRRGSRS